MTSGAHRKVVTVLFCDVVGSTALGESVDPEALQALLARYFECLKAIVETHGGVVDKFIGDAVMAVFGVPLAHEDDALRACRAACEMRDALPELGVEGRIGVNTGEVLTGTDERLVTGDAVNVAARLEQAAAPGEVLIGGQTLGHAQSAVEVGEELRLELKGKREPVPAFPLVAVHEVVERSHAFPFVGRLQELQELADAWDRALTDARCELVTVVGEPGVGKSRLVAEALGRIAPRVVRARCLSYGEGITYWPVVEVVKQLDTVPSDEQAAESIRSLLRESERAAGTDEIAWAFRKLLEEQAPLVACFDDIQWGEETFLDLLESITLLSEGAPLLLICMARPELLNRRPGWPAVLRLQPLPEEEAVALVGDAVSDQVRQRIVYAAGGNPLFLTEMVALSDESGSEVEVPATLRAVLAARLDQLDEAERGVLERGSVEGELFHRGAVQALAPEETEVVIRLAALVRKDLLRPARPVLRREDAYRFNHLLIRDAAYDALPKAKRADLHCDLAAWLAGHGRELVELDEILGYHLEQAARYLDELGRPEPKLAERAGELLAAAGRHALSRDDRNAAASLLERALALTRPVRLDVALETDLANAVGLADLRRAAAIADAAAEQAHEAGDAAGEAHARVVSAGMRGWIGECSDDEREQVALAAIPLLESVGAEAGLADAWQVLFMVGNSRSRWAEALAAAEKAIEHARLAGRKRADLYDWVATALVWGPVPADEGVRRIDQRIPEPRSPYVLGARALLEAMLGRFETAWPEAEEQCARLRIGGYSGEMTLGVTAMVAGEDTIAVQHLETACEEFEAIGNIGTLGACLDHRARLLFLLGRQDEFLRVCAEIERLEQRYVELGAVDAATSSEEWSHLRALTRVGRGEYAEAERLAGVAVRLAEQTDDLLRQGNVFFDLGQILDAAGRPPDAAAAYNEALDRYERKQIIPLARRTRERLAELEPA